MSSKSHWRINENINSPELRVIDADGKQVGVLARAKAQKLARESGLDLVEIAPKAKPPVARVVDFGKFRYAEEKKLKQQKKKNKASELKEVRFSPFIAQQDYNTRLSRVVGFLNDGSKIRIVVSFKGRQMGSKNYGYKLTERVLTDLKQEDVNVAIDMEPKFLGRRLNMVISPVKTKTKNAETKNKEISSKKV